MPDSAQDGFGRREANRESEASSEDDSVQRRLARLQAAHASSAGAETSPNSAAASEDKRSADRRREERRTGPAVSARIVLRGLNEEVKLFNLSGKGAMIGTTIAAEADDRIAIQFGECNPIHGTVRWTRDGLIGIEFARQTALLVPAQWRFVGGRRSGEAPSEKAHRPRPPRQELLWECELYLDENTLPARLRNISAQGAMIDAPEDVPVDTEVLLSLKSAGSVSATVRWCHCGQIGLKFEREFNLRKLIDPRKLDAPASTPSGILKPLYLESELDPTSPWAGEKQKLRPQDLR